MIGYIELTNIVTRIINKLSGVNEDVPVGYKTELWTIIDKNILQKDLEDAFDIKIKNKEMVEIKTFADLLTHVQYLLE